MQWTKKFDLFLFDLDGLLVDTEKIHFTSYQTLCSRYDYDLPWDFEEYIEIAHKSAEGLKEAILPNLSGTPSWENVYREKKEIYLESLKKGSLALMPGVEALLKTLAEGHVKRCVVTHSSKEQTARIKMIVPQLKTIPLWITREDYNLPKPAPDGYQRAIEILADPGDRIIGFEDSLRGLEALKETIAKPVLICDPSHPQMSTINLTNIPHYPSFTKIPSKFQ